MCKVKSKSHRTPTGVRAARAAVAAGQQNNEVNNDVREVNANDDEFLMPIGTASLEFGLGLGFFITFSHAIIKYISIVQPEPYLDEVFHIPQTQKYCNGSYSEWDPKITTLPGTYLLASLAASGAEHVQYVFDFDFNPCSVFGLRMFNFVLGLLNFCLIKSILDMYWKIERDLNKVLATVNISMFPVLYFFNFLFYTDITSTFALLCMHYAFIWKRFTLSAFYGGLAVFTRQTNIIWVVWHCLLLGFNYLQTADVDDENANGRRGITSIIKGYIVKVRRLAWTILKEAWADYQDFVGYITVVLLFAGFILWNGGIVVGDKSAHVASLNFPQLGYFTIVFGFFCSPYIILRLPSTLKYIYRHKWYAILGLLGFTAAVHFNTVAHPYLLADNRHYPFYLWKNIFQACVWARYALIPFYVLIWAFIFDNCDTYITNYYALSLLICATLQLVPQLLLEFRYFIPIYLMVRVAIRKPTMWELVFEFILHLGVNMFTFAIFLYKPFVWPSEENAQRFMW